ncbi:hypothetical protein [Shimia ponticola]|uniref:hypothetical protein n=1 Tax=Shimia ponticola TaxID=2582893 RepID=UPI00164B66B0|nr:hypothetical protein [Shimia ponticola]
MKAVRVFDISFDPSAGIYKGTVTLTGPRPLWNTRVKVEGHRNWTPGQVVTALKTRAEA